MARKSGKAPITEVEEVMDEEVEEQDAEGDSADGGPEAEGRPRSKAGAARATLAEGITVPKVASAHIKKKYGIDISPQQFSAEKSRLKHRGGLPGLGEGFLAAPPRHNAQDDSDILEAMAVIKPLITQLGADKVKQMVDLLG